MQKSYDKSFVALEHRLKVLEELAAEVRTLMRNEYPDRVPKCHWCATPFDGEESGGGGGWRRTKCCGST